MLSLHQHLVVHVLLNGVVASGHSVRSVPVQLQVDDGRRPLFPVADGSACKAKLLKVAHSETSSLAGSGSSPASSRPSALNTTLLEVERLLKPRSHKRHF